MTADMIKPIVDAVTNNVTAVLPSAVSIMALFIGIKAVPRIIKSFM